jgi:hypothetical protein
MLRTFFLIVVLCCSFLLSQARALMADRSSSSALELVYLQDGTTLTTYSVDRQTLSATQLGQPFMLPMSTFIMLTPSLNGRFLYIQGTDSSQKQHLWVFATDASGVPQNPPLQVLEVDGLFGFALDPGVNFAYAVMGLLNSQNQLLFSIERYVVDSNTGKLSSPAIVATYPPNGPCPEGSYGASLGLSGFSPSGKTLYDDWYCSYRGGVDATYYARIINSQTGILGPDVEVYQWTNNAEGYDNVTFINNKIIDFSIPNPYGEGFNSLSIYPVVPNSKTPLLRCTASMLDACGYSIGDLVHPSGKYIFFTLNYYNEQIASVDFHDKTLVNTGHFIPYQVSRFSPDGTIVYAVSVGSVTYDWEIFGFNPDNGDITTTGGVIHAPAISDTFWPVLRQ